MNNKLKIGILWADPYNENLGVGALAYSSLALIADVIKAKQLTAEISFLCLSQYKEGIFEYGDERLKFQSFPILDYLKLKSIAQLILLPKRFQTSKLLGFDYVFDISAGDSFSDIYGANRFYKMLNTKLFFLYLGKKVILLPQTIGPFKDPKIERKAFNAMNKMEVIISRDKQSYDYSSKFIPSKKILEAIDVAFYLPFNKSEYNNNKINVGINISGLLWNGGYTKNNQFDMKSNYVELILKTIKYFSAIENVQIHLIPHVTPKNSPVEDDYATCESIKKEYLPDAILAPRFESPMHAKSYISGLDFFTGARMHACIAAYSSGVPVYLMAYSRKFNGLFVDTLKYSCIGDCVNEETDIVFEKLKQAFTRRADLGKEILHSLDTIAKPRLESLKNILANIIKS